MEPSFYLKNLARSGSFSNLIDIPFLLLAKERGVAGEDDLAPAVVMLTEDQKYDLSKKDYLSWLYINAGVTPEQASFRMKLSEGRYEDGSERNVEENRILARNSYRLLEGLFPGAAYSYRPWYDEIQKLDKRADNEAKRQFVAHHYRVFKETSEWEEVEFQSVIEQKFWNKIGLKILENVEGADYIWLRSAADFIDRIDGDDPYTGSTARAKFDAVAVQLPILSAAIALELEKHAAAHRIVRIGLETVVEAGADRKAISIKTPEFASLDVATRIHKSADPADRLVTLPMGSAQLGEKRWKELMESPLFVKHASKLVPSDAFWDILYPSTTPGAVPRALEERMKKLSGNGQHVWAQIEDTGKINSYGITIVNQTKSEGGYFTNAALTLRIENGKIESASYTVAGKQPIKIVLDEKRVLALSARGRRAHEKAAKAAKYEAGGYDKPLGEPFDDTVDATGKAGEETRAENAGDDEPTRAAEKSDRKKKKSAWPLSDEARRGLPMMGVTPKVGPK